MKNQKEIYGSLLIGETLIHVSGNKTRLSAGGCCEGSLTLDVDGGFPSFYRPAEWSIYEEPKWYENIPEGGVLCKCGNNYEIKDITSYNPAFKYAFTSPIDAWVKAIPLTRAEIQIYMNNAPQ